MEIGEGIAMPLTGWENDIHQTKTNLGESTQRITNARASERNMVFSEFWETPTHNVVGINTNEIPNMIRAIETYVTDIHETANSLSSDFDPTIACKGTNLDGAILEYQEATKNYILGLTSQLNVFVDKLREVERAWNTQDEEVATKVRTESQSSGFNAGMYTPGA